MEETNVAHVAAQMADWRKSDANDSLELRQHVEELLRLNRSLRQTTLDHLTTDAFTKLQISVQELHKTVNDVLLQNNTAVKTVNDLAVVMQKRHKMQVDDIAERAAAKAVAAREGDAQSVMDLWRKHVQDTQDFWQSDERRWGKLNLNVVQLQERVAQLEEAADTRGKSLTSQVDSIQGSLIAQVETKLTAAVQDMGSAARQSTLEATKQVAEQVHVTSESLKTTLSEMLGPMNHDLKDSSRTLGAMVKDSSSDRAHWRSIEGAVKSLGAILQQGLRACQEEARRWKDEANNRTSSVQLELERCKAKAGEDSQRISLEVDALHQRLKAKEHELEAAPVVLGRELLSRIRNVEDRGNIRVAIRNGEIEVIKAISFVQPKVVGKTAVDVMPEFADAPLASDIMHDVKELAGMFDSPISLETYMKVQPGMAPDQLQKLSMNRAMVAAASLGEAGIPVERISAKGLVGKKNRGCLSFRLNLLGQ